MARYCQWPLLAWVLSCDAVGADKAGAGEVLFELNSLFPVAESQDATAPRQTWLKLEAAFEKELWREGVNFFASLVMEPVAMGDTHLFGNEGLFLEEAGFAVELGEAQLLFGKFNPPFGLVWEDDWGIFHDDFADEYELTEQVGAALELNGWLAGGEHQLFLGAFTDDRSVFSDSAITSRGRNRSDAAGGLAQLQSLLLAVQGELPVGAGALGYHMAYRELAPPQAGAAEQRGVVASFSYDRQLPADIFGKLLLEWAEFTHFFRPRDRVRLVTPVLALQKGRLELSASKTRQQLSDGGGVSRLAQFTLRYQLPRQASLSLGWKRESGPEGSFQQVGVRFATSLAF